MEPRTSYGTAVKIRGACFAHAEGGWQTPSGEEIRAILSSLGWTQEEAARFLLVNPRSLRRWVLNESKIPYAAWGILCYEAGYGEIWRH